MGLAEFGGVGQEDVGGGGAENPVPTALTVCLNRPDGDRAILTAPGCLLAFGPEHLADVQARHLHSASCFLQPKLAQALPALFSQARGHGATISLDTNHDPSGRWRLEPGLLQACDVILPNEGEALALTGADELPAAMTLLAAHGGVPVLKRGAAGAVALQDGRFISARPAAGGALVDTVGAGDSFDAGFLAGWLSGRSVGEALALGCACGTLSARGIGGTSTQATAAEAGDLARAVIVSIQDER